MARLHNIRHGALRDYHSDGLCDSSRLTILAKGYHRKTEGKHCHG